MLKLAAALALILVGILIADSFHDYSGPLNPCPQSFFTGGPPVKSNNGKGNGNGHDKHE